MLAHGVLHADETPVAMLKPGQGKTHRAYLWAYAPMAFEDLRAVIYDLTESRAGAHARDFLGDWRGSLVCDEFGGCKASFALGVTQAGCLVHARRKFVDLQVTGKSLIAETAVRFFKKLYEVEREVRALDADERQYIGQVCARPPAGLPQVCAHPYKHVRASGRNAFRYTSHEITSMNPHVCGHTVFKVRHKLIGLAFVRPHGELINVCGH